MGGFTNWIVGEYFDLLVKVYRVPSAMVTRDTGVSPEIFRCRDLSIYPVDDHVLKLAALLDQNDFFRKKELALVDYDARKDAGLLLPPTEVKLAIAEQRTRKNLKDFFCSLASRFGVFLPSHEFWVEEDEGVRFCLRPLRPGCEFYSLQGLFLFLLKEIALIFSIDESLIRVNFPGCGIDDEEGFSLKGTRNMSFSGDTAYIHIDLPSSFSSRYTIFEHGALPISEALDDLMRKYSRDPRLSDSVSSLLVRNLVEDNRSLDGDAVCSLLGMSRTTLHRRLKEEGCSFRELRTSSRLERAKKLLRTTGMSVSLISDTLGFSDSSAFSRSFKTFSGSSPLEYRNQARNSTFENKVGKNAA